MTFGGFQSASGKFYRYFPLKWSFLGAIFVFEIGSLVCAVAQNSTTFVVGRAIAGVGSAAVVTGAFTMAALSAEPKRRPALMGLVGAVYGLSSVVGPLLEHSRVYYFANGGDEEVYIGSSDWMPRNLDRRVEVIAPVENVNLKTYLKNEYLAAYLRDNVKARELQSDGFYKRVAPQANEMEFNCQLSFQTSPKVVRFDSKH